VWWKNEQDCLRLHSGPDIFEGLAVGALVAGEIPGARCYLERSIIDQRKCRTANSATRRFSYGSRNAGRESGHPKNRVGTLRFPRLLQVGGIPKNAGSTRNGEALQVCQISVGRPGSAGRKTPPSIRECMFFQISISEDMILEKVVRKSSFPFLLYFFFPLFVEEDDDFAPRIAALVLFLFFEGKVGTWACQGAFWGGCAVTNLGIHVPRRTERRTTMIIQPHPVWQLRPANGRFIIIKRFRGPGFGQGQAGIDGLVSEWLVDAGAARGKCIGLVTSNFRGRFFYPKNLGQPIPKGSAGPGPGGWLLLVSGLLAGRK